MLKKIVSGGICLLLAVIGVLLAVTLLGPFLETKPQYVYIMTVCLIGLGMAILGIFVAPPLSRACEKLFNRVISAAAQLRGSEIFSCVIGLISGLIVASLVGSQIARLGVIGKYAALVLLLFFGYVGLSVGYRKREDMSHLLLRNREAPGARGSAEKSRDKRDKNAGGDRTPPKVLDTSVIIDSRILDLCRTGFLEGDLIISNFVLEELRHIADSADSLRRARGRHGLDCLNALRAEFGDRVQISDRDYPDETEVDIKLLRLAQELHCPVVTNDYNLNKVAQLQGIPVLNVNDLANAVKSVVLPGEEMPALLIREGKEAGQAVAYLDDGTMIVVDNGKRWINTRILIIVTSILQTAAGRIIFARPKYGKAGEAIPAPQPTPKE